MQKIAVNTIVSLFLVGLLIFSIISVVGLVFLTKMAYSKPDANDKICGNVSRSERNVARIAVIVLWVQFAWIILGSILKNVWGDCNFMNYGEMFY